MNRQKFLAELSRLLGFMSSWDRDAEMNKYIEMLDAAEDEEALIESLGTPTQLAISVALGYKPTPRPGTQPPEPEPAPVSEPEASGQAAPEPEPEQEPEQEDKPEPPPPPKKRDELQIVTDGEFEYGMELAILMGEPISAAVESALNGEYLPDPDFSLEEILKEARGEPDIVTGTGASESEDTEAQNGGDGNDAGAEPEPPAEDAPDGHEKAQSEQSPQEELPEETEPETVPGEAAAETETVSEPVRGVEEAQPETAAGPENAGEPEPKPAAPQETPAAQAPDEAGTAVADQPETLSAEAAQEAEPVFDKSTAPLPESLISAENGTEHGEKPAGEAGPHPPELVFDPDKFAELPPDEPIQPHEPDEPGRPHRSLRPAATAAYVLFSLIIGLPVTLLLILVGVPVLLFGGGIVALAVYAAVNIITALSMFSDISLVAGTGLVICGVGLLIAWLGLWISVELGSLWINSVVLRLGRAMCFEKEADGE